MQQVSVAGAYREGARTGTGTGRVSLMAIGLVGRWRGVWGTWRQHFKKKVELSWRKPKKEKPTGTLVVQFSWPRSKICF